MKPLCIDLFCGLGGWTEGFLSEGWEVIGYDIHEHVYGEERYPAQLVLQDVLTIHGSQFRNADIIVASPPCQQYSWLAMPWSRSKDPNNSKAAKALRAKWEAEGPDNRLFDACFRIQREAIYARRLELRCCELDYSKPGCPRCHIPLIVENVRGAQEWVGRAPWNYGSFYLWGDVPALMPIGKHRKVKGVQSWSDFGKPGYKAIAFNDQAIREMRAIDDAVKIGGDSFSDPNSTCRKHGSKSRARKAASAKIAKIPLPLSSHIARVFRPTHRERAA